MLNVSAQNVEGVLNLRCSGRIVRGEVDIILCAAVREHAKEVILDLSEVTAIDAGGIGALLSLQAAGIYLKLVNATPPVREVLRLTSTDRVLEISECAAVPAMAPATAAAGA